MHSFLTACMHLWTGLKGRACISTLLEEDVKGGRVWNRLVHLHVVSIRGVAWWIISVSDWYCKACLDSALTSIHH